MTRSDKLFTLLELGADSTIDASYKQLSRWANDEKANFPVHKRTVGRFKFYDDDEVREWVSLRRRATANYKNGSTDGKG